ncbi:MAG: glycosyltransferase [Candidatus Binatia bacterium]
MEGQFLTILMPLKNYHLQYLQRSIESVITQSYSQWKLLVIVEKGDFHHFGKTLKKELNDSRIEIITNQGRKLAGAINSGMRYARTEFVALLLADDMWSVDAAEILNDYMVRYPQVDFFHSSRVVINEHGKFVSPVYYSKEQFDIDEFKWRSPVKHLLCWRKEKALSIGGLDESLNSVGPDDYDFPWMMAEKGAIFKAVKECLYYYRNHCESYRLTTHIPLSVHKREIKRILKKHGVGIFSRMLIVAKKRKIGAFGEQCLYRSAVDRWIKEKFRGDARRNWRQKYTGA